MNAFRGGPVRAGVMIGCVVALGLTLAACEGLKDTLGWNKQSPDEFVVVTRAPLTLPPDFTLRPPAPRRTPAARNRQPLCSASYSPPTGRSGLGGAPPRPCSRRPSPAAKITHSSGESPAVFIIPSLASGVIARR